MNKQAFPEQSKPRPITAPPIPKPPSAVRVRAPRVVGAPGSRQREWAVGAAGAAAAPVLFSQRRYIKNDLLGPRRESVGATARRGDILITARPASLQTGYLDKGVSFGSGTPNAYHAAVVSGINEHGEVFMHDHGPSGTFTNRKLDPDNNIVTILRPKDVTKGEATVANMEARSKLTEDIYKGLKARGVPERAVNRELGSFYSNTRALTNQIFPNMPGVPGLGPPSEKSLALKLGQLKDMGVDLPNILDKAAESLKAHGKLPDNTPLRALDDICTSALAGAGAPIIPSANVSKAMAIDFLRAAGPKGAYEAVGHVIPVGERVVTGRAALASRMLHPALMAGAGLTAGVLGARAVHRLQGRRATKPPQST